MASQLTLNNIHHIYSVDQVRKIDRLAITEYQISAYDLMRRAGRAAYETLRAQFPSISSLTVLAGSGNNGGDGYVVANLAARSGISVSVLTVGNLEHQSHEAHKARDQYLQDGHHEQPFEGTLPSDSDVLVDALLGTGLHDRISNTYRQAVDAMNDSSVPVISLDVPSGLDADTGTPLPVAVRAQVTVTFVGIKPGLLTGTAADHTGQLYYDALGIPVGAFIQFTALATTTSQPMLRKNLPPRSRCAYKNNFGHALLIGSGTGFPNAIRLSAEACARTGAGLVSVVTHKDNSTPVAIGCPTAMVHSITDVADLNTILEKSTVIGIGPGLTTGSWAREIFSHILDTDKPLVVDADGLTLLAEDSVKRDNWILTPHPGEAARLLNCSNDDIQRNRIDAAQAIAQRYGGIVVLKGAGTVIYSREKMWINHHANPGLASGGTGDVLTGIIVGLLAQGLYPEYAAACGVYVHSQAADLATYLSPRGTVASDLMQAIRTAVNP